jgi:hypothetical protein
MVVRFIQLLFFISYHSSLSQRVIWFGFRRRTLVRVSPTKHLDFFVKAPTLRDDKKLSVSLKRIEGDEKITNVNFTETDTWLKKHTTFAAARLMGRVYALRGEELPGVVNWNVLKALIVESVAGKFYGIFC